MDPSDFTCSFDGLNAEEKAMIVGDLKQTVLKTVQDAIDGKQELMPFIPTDLAAPYTALVLGSAFAENIKLEDDFLELGFSMKHMNMLTKKQMSLLKPIEGDFSKETNEEGDAALAQVLVDDNFVNSIFAVFLSIEKMYSLREMGKGHTKVEPFLHMLTTSTIGTLLPQFTEEYGAGKKIDLVFTPSHEFFLDGFPKSKMSGVYMDKNGNFKFMLNVAFQINVETMPGMWDAVRNIFMTLTFKMKVSETILDGLKAYQVTPKSIELNQLKVMKDENVIEMEQMML